VFVNAEWIAVYENWRVSTLMLLSWLVTSMLVVMPLLSVVSSVLRN